MNPHALKVLEFRRMLEYLTEYTESDLTHRLILELQPLVDERTIRTRLAEVSEFRDLLHSTSPPFFNSPMDIAPILAKSRKLGIRLLPREILQIAVVIIISDKISRYFSKAEGCELLKEKAESISSFTHLGNSISRSIDSSGEILDSASEMLSQIRRKIRRMHEKLRTRMEGMAAELYRQGFLQDPLVMIRNNRFVLPVKAPEYRQVPGIVHDRSSSGATLFIEPQSLLSENNELARLYQDEVDEIDRILAHLTSEIGESSETLEVTLAITAEFDLIQAKSRMADDMEASNVRINSGNRLLLTGCRNPLLVLQKIFRIATDAEIGEVVPIDLDVGDPNTILVITGPNTGGKTVALKTIGLIVLMVQTGLHIPCGPDSEIGIFHDVFADIGDEQSLVQSLSTFSGHLKNIIEILKNTESGDLVLLDELGAGTDPAEGSALGITILSELLHRKALTIVTTHHNAIKAYAFTTEGICNAAVAFDIQTLKPAYSLMMGQIGQSNALLIAERLGFPQNLLKDAQTHLSGVPADLERMLQIVEKERSAARKFRQKADLEKERARDLRKAREDVLNAARKEASKIVGDAAKKSDLLVTELQRERDRIRDEIKAWRQMSRESKSDGAWKLLESLDQTARIGIEKAQEKLVMHKASLPGPDHQHVEIRGLARGKTVYAVPFESDGQVVGIHPGDMVSLDIKGKRVKLHVSQLAVAAKDPASSEEKKDGSIRMVLESADQAIENIPLRLNLIGLTVEEALDELERYFDRVVRAGIPEVTVIHGFGTGRLADAVVQYLKKHPFVSRGRRGEPSEGGGGVTVVEMKNRG